MLGVVQSVKPYGAFIDIGGVTGLLHVSQISHERIMHVDKYLSEGDKLKVGRAACCGCRWGLVGGGLLQGRAAAGAGCCRGGLLQGRAAAAEAGAGARARPAAGAALRLAGRAAAQPSHGCCAPAWAPAAGGGNPSSRPAARSRSPPPPSTPPAPRRRRSPPLTARAQVMILSQDKDRGRVTLSTKKLEPEPGDFLRDPAKVFEKAEEMAATFRERVAVAEAAARMEESVQPADLAPSA